MVECQIKTSRGSCNLLLSLKLHLVNQILVTLLCKPTTLIYIQVHIVNIESHVLQLRKCGCGCRQGCIGSIGLHQICCSSESDVETNLMILECNQGECKTRVAIEPKLQRDIQDILTSIASLKARCCSCILTTHHGIQLQ